MERHVLVYEEDALHLSQLQENSKWSDQENWTVYFVNSEEEARSQMDAHAVDILVLFVPEGQEAQRVRLLTSVRRKYPDTMRLVVSQAAKSEPSFQLLKLANTCMASPVLPQDLLHSCRRLIELREMISDDHLRREVSRLDQLPSVPDSYWELRRAIEDPESTIDKIEAIVSADPAMATKVLQMANSAFYGGGESKRDLKSAITHLGLRALSDLVLVAQFVTAYQPSICPKFSIKSLWKQSLLVGQHARKIAALQGKSRDFADECFLGGLLHGVGKLIFAVSVPEAYTQILAGDHEDLQEELDHEKELFGVTHPVLGAYLVGVWGMPRSLIQAILYIYIPSEYSGQHVERLAILHAASYFACEELKLMDGVLDRSFLEREGFAERFALWERRGAKS